MAAKMAVYYKKYKKIFPETGKLKLMHHSEFDIFKMASRMVADKFYKPVGAAPNL